MRYFTSIVLVLCLLVFFSQSLLAQDCPPPSNIAISSQTSTSATLSWEAPPDALSYVVDVYVDNELYETIETEDTTLTITYPSDAEEVEVSVYRICGGTLSDPYASGTTTTVVVATIDDVYRLWNNDKYNRGSAYSISLIVDYSNIYEQGSTINIWSYNHVYAFKINGNIYDVACTCNQFDQVREVYYSFTGGPNKFFYLHYDEAPYSTLFYSLINTNCKRNNRLSLVSSLPDLFDGLFSGNAETFKTTNTLISTVLSNGLSISPNPTKHSTQLNYSLAEDTDISIQLYNYKGELQQSDLVNGYQFSGIYQRRLDVSELPAGIYLIVLETSTEKIVQKMVKIE
mgnify:CR=1 FL=1|jgi:hypothetical protein